MCTESECKLHDSEAGGQKSVQKLPAPRGGNFYFSPNDFVKNPAEILESETLLVNF